MPGTAYCVFFSFHSALSAIAAGSFLFSELASQTMTADRIKLF